MSCFIIPRGWILNVSSLWNDVYKKNPYALNVEWMRITHNVSLITDWPIAAERSGLYRFMHYVITCDIYNYVIVIRSDSLEYSVITGYQIDERSNQPTKTHVSHKEVIRQIVNLSQSRVTIENDARVLISKMQQIGLLRHTMKIAEGFPLLDTFFFENRHLVDVSLDPNRSHYFFRTLSPLDKRLLSFLQRQQIEAANKQVRIIVPLDNGQNAILLKSMRNPISYFSYRNARVKIGIYGSIPLLSLNFLFGEGGIISSYTDAIHNLEYTGPDVFEVPQAVIDNLHVSLTFREFVKIVVRSYQTFDFTNLTLTLANSSFMRKLTTREKLDLFNYSKSFFGTLR